MFNFVLTFDEMCSLLVGNRLHDSSIGVSFVAGSPFPSLFMLNIESEMGRARGNSWKMESEAS